MQQRYYDPTVGRFLSTDPVAAYSKKGINFNRYWYASNNPYRFIDPDGRWVCASDASKANCDSFRSALARVDQASRSDSLSKSQQDTLSKAVSFYGKEGDKNVTVSFADLKGANGNATSNSATFDMNALKRSATYGSSAENNSLNALAKTVAHEGDHGWRDADGSYKAMTRYEMEKKGYEAQAVYQKAAGFMDTVGANGWTRWGDIEQKTINGQAAYSTIFACGSLTGCDGQ